MRMAEAAKAVDSRYFDEAMAKFRELDQQEASFMSGAIPPSSETTSFERRFGSSESAAEMKPPSTGSVRTGGVAERAAASADTAAGVKRSAASMFAGPDKQPPALFVR